MKVLVLGGSSALAQHLIPLLINFAEVKTAGRYDDQYRLDLTAPRETWVFPSGIDVVVNLAAHFGGNDIASLEAAQEVNARGVLRLAQACQDAGVRHLLHISSIFATLPTTSPFYSAYSLTKAQGEDLVRLAVRNSSLELTLLRASQLYGPLKHFGRLQPFFYAILARAAAGEDIVLYGRHDALRNFIHVDDFVEVIARCISGQVIGEFNCIAQKSLSYGQLARTAIDVFGSSSRILFDLGQPDIADNDFTADDRLYRKLNFFPRISLVEGIIGLVDEMHSLRGHP